MRSYLPRITNCLSQFFQNRGIQNDNMMNFFENQSCRLMSIKSEDKGQIKAKQRLGTFFAKSRVQDREQKLSSQLLQYKKLYPIHFSVQYGSISDASLSMADANAVNALDLRPDGTSQYPLFRAAAAGRADMIKLLIEKGAAVDAVSPSGLTALLVAIAKGHKSAVLALVKKGAGIERAQSHTGYTPLMFAVNSYRPRKIWGLHGEQLDTVSPPIPEKCVQFLIDNGARIDAKDNYGGTALHHAADNGDKATLILLIRRGAALDVKDMHGDIPLHAAAAKGRTDCIEALLIGKGKELINSANNHGMTALHFASTLIDCTSSVSMLIKNGADPELMNELGDRAFRPDIDSAKSTALSAFRMNLLLFFFKINILFWMFSSLKFRTPFSSVKSKDLSKALSEEIKPPERTILGKDKNTDDVQKLVQGKQSIEGNNHLTVSNLPEVQTEFDSVKRKKKAAITSVDQKSRFQFEVLDGHKSALFDILQAKVAARSAEPVQSPFSWAAAKLEIDMTGSSDAEQAEESMLQAAVLDAAELELYEDSDWEGGSSSQPGENSVWSEKPHCRDKDCVLDAGYHIENQQPLDLIEFAPLTMKWLARADKKAREMLLRRVKLLAEGRRSYALSKRLQNTHNPIYEAKLGGQRILWTKLKRVDTLSILVWCVSHHDDVPNYVQKIDQAFARLSNKFVIVNSYVQGRRAASATHSESALQMSEDDVLLNPIGNVPLKLSIANLSELPRIAELGWKPHPRLSKAQREINGQGGTVLLLGRSGTGKTLCLSERMTLDRERAPYGINQLFVSHSKRVCELVRGIQQLHSRDSPLRVPVDFMTLDAFVSRMHSAICSCLGLVKRAYPKGKRVDFQRFQAMYLEMQTKSRMDALIAWTQIRSFIKGSIEAALAGRPLTLDEYMGLAEERCRLAPDQRREAYAVYEAYKGQLQRRCLWDESGRTMDFLSHWILSGRKAVMATGRGGEYDRVYVDEVQDCTQAEIALFFVAAGLRMQALFLAGDPAQSVVEGVDFRFEEVRAIVHQLSSGRERIARPTMLAVNFRSHTGILDCAAAVLGKLFAFFPGAAKVLHPDRGLFHGPRPAFWRPGGAAAASLGEILARSQRLVVLCPDDQQEALALLCPDHLVFGIREAKGLEFPDVALVDFFACLPVPDQRVWRLLLRGGSGDGVGGLSLAGFAPYAHPQVEMQLKRLYTAVTRSCRRLILIETRASIAGEAFFRWLEAEGLAEPLAAAGAEEEALITVDELRAQGVDLALTAASDAGPTGRSLLRKAIACFARAGDDALQERAVAQLEAWDLAQRLLADDPRAGAAGGPVPPTECIAPAFGEGGEGAAEKEDSTGRPRAGGLLSEAEEAGAVDMMARCGRLGLWDEARAVYDACAPRAASVVRLQAALLARI